MTAADSVGPRAPVADVSVALDELCAFAADLDVKRLPSETLRVARACLLYGLAVGVATRHARPASLATEASRAAGSAGDGPVTRLHDDTPTSFGNAAFANAVLLSGRVQGDSHPCGHLGGVIIPASLGAIEQARGTGAELLAAMVAGYEAALRIGRDHAADLTRRGFRTTPCYGVFGAAVAIARARRLDAARIRHAIGLAVNFAAGLREYVDAGTEESPFQAGFAARNATHVADLVGLGVEATPSGLYGAAGFYQAYGDPARTDYGVRLADALGERFEFTSLTIKRYPACQFVRAVIRGLIDLRQRADGARPDRIRLRLNPFEADFIGMRHAGPFRTAPQTVMSAPFCAALTWVRGSVTYHGLREFDDSAVNDLARRVDVIADDTRALYEPVVTVTLDDGRVLEWEERADPTADRMSWSAAVEMTYQLFDEARVPRPMADGLIACVEGIDGSPGVGPLVRQVCGAIRIDR